MLMRISAQECLASGIAAKIVIKHYADMRFVFSYDICDARSISEIHSNPVFYEWLSVKHNAVGIQ
jgi:hypothetical protein